MMYLVIIGKIGFTRNTPNIAITGIGGITGCSEASYRQDRGTKFWSKGAFINYHQGWVADKWYGFGSVSTTPPYRRGADSMTPPIGGVLIL